MVRKALLAVALLLGACASDDDPSLDRAAAPSTAPTTLEATTTTAAPTTTTTAPTTTTTAPPAFTPLAPGGEPRAVVTATGLTLPVRAVEPGGFRVATPCGREAVVPAAGTQPLAGAHVVLDPGHGGEETGTAGDADNDGTREYPEKVLNFDVTRRVKARLEARGATVVLTRNGDYRIALRTRAEIGVKLQPLAFVSIHFNGGHDLATPEPGTETYYQIASPTSKRLAGLLYEEIVAALGTFEGVQWVADRDFGAKYRPAGDGGDYYGILRRTAGIPAALAELGFLNNPPEAALYQRADVQDAMADAVTRAIVRFVGTDDPGSGYVEPYPRTEPAGPGGGVEGCVDPPLR